MASLLANEQSNSGNTVDVIYSIRPETPPNLRDFFKKKISLKNIQMSGKKSISSILEVRKHLIKNKPNKIFLHSSFAGFIGRIATILLPFKCKIFYIPHCISFMRRDIGIVKRSIFIALEIIGSIKNCEYIACSESEKKYITRIIPFRKCHIIENAINTTEIKPITRNDETSIIKEVITVGQIRTQKSPELFSRIAKIVNSKSKDIKFRWIGDGDPTLKKNLEDAGVSVSGWQPKEIVIQDLKSSGIYLSTALWEGMPVSLIEAMATGLPIVASTCPGNIDIITHKKNGWLYNSASEAADQILEIINSPQNSIQISKRAQIESRSRFSVDRYLREIEAITK